MHGAVLVHEHIIPFGSHLGVEFSCYDLVRGGARVLSRHVPEREDRRLHKGHAGGRPFPEVRGGAPVEKEH